MSCPRCGANLVTFAIEGAAGKAVVCENCGFADTPASHRPEGIDAESWDEAIARFDDSSRRDETCRTVRVEETPTPAATNETDAAIDPDRLDEPITITAPPGAADRREDRSDEEKTEESSE